tara:strand:+ start:1052 stop:2041 length:990 start_codon:yes stop_codon:yes gene_type:complete
MSPEREHIMISTKEQSNALTIMEQAGALFNVTYPPARYWDEGNTTVDDYPMPLVQEGKNKDTPQYKWAVRADTNAILGLHSGTYPENESYEYLGEMAERMFPNSTTGCTVIGEGERIMLKQDIGETIDLGGDDTIKPQVLWISSFNGSWATSVMDSVYRWFCSNQIIDGAAIFKCRHTQNHNYTLEHRANILNLTIERANRFAEMARILKDQAYTNAQFETLTKELIPDPRPFTEDEKKEGEASQRRWTVVLKKRQALDTKWKEECEHFQAANKWLAYNAIQGAEQHRINSGFQETEAAINKALVKAVDGKSPLASRAASLLMNEPVLI